jgi:putative ABC transport system permease protein
MLEDIRYAFRLLAARPMLSLVAIVTVALGIAANTTIFSVVDGILWRPLPYPDAAQLVSVWTSYPASNGEPDVFSPPNYLDVRQSSETLDSIAILQDSGQTIDVENSEPENVRGLQVSASFFKVLGVAPVRGRYFTDAEDDSGQLMVVLSYGTWQRRFGGDPAIIGKKVELSRRPYTVVGVAPPEINVPGPREFYIPMNLTSDQKANRGAIYVDAIARVKPGIAREKADAELKAIAARLAKAYPDTCGGIKMGTDSLRDSLVGRNTRTALLTLLVAVAMVLAIGCANLANLLLAASTGRRREFAVRSALGAPGYRLVRQLLTESLMLSLAGGALGIAVSLWLVPALMNVAPRGTPLTDQVRIDWRVVEFSLATSLLTGLAFGLIPAFSAWKTDLTHWLKEGSRGASAGSGARRFGNALVIAEVAVVLALLVAAGLVIRSYSRMTKTNVGFSAERLITWQLFLPAERFKEDGSRREAARTIIERVSALPGVESVALADPGPFSQVPMVLDTGFRIAGRPEPPANNEPVAMITRVSAGYFRSMAIPVIAGREFNDTDRQGTTDVMLISELLAKRHFPNENPVGQRIVLGRRQPRVVEIVGVVADVKHNDVASDMRTEFYLPLEQSPRRAVNLLVRTKGSPQNLIEPLKATIWRDVHPSIPANLLSTMEAAMGRSLQQPRFITMLLAGFAGLALVLALVGIYGVIAYSVSQRTREFGVRFALGADMGSVLGLVLRQGLLLVGFGVVAGLALSFLTGRLLTRILFETQPVDLMTYLVVTALILLVSALACWIPARRAASVDPLVALRDE